MKSRKIMFTTVLSALVCFGLCQQVQSATDTPDPGGKPLSNTADGVNALLSITTGLYNSAFGFDAVLANSDASFDTAVGAGALLSNSTGSDNNAVGAFALFNNNASFNNAVGHSALQANVGGVQNNAMGDLAMVNNTSGSRNTAIGDDALFENISGNNNTAVGDEALAANGNSGNTAVGAQASNFNTIGSGNTAVGFQALKFNLIGGGNTAVGSGALVNATAGFNIAVGVGAGSAVTTATNVISIGSLGADSSNTCFIGNIRGVTTDVADAIPVLIDSAGQLGTASSSQRFKKDIKPMETTSNSILGLQPVTFHYKSDKSNTPQFGLIAEEVAKVNPDLVVHDKNGQIYTVRYDAVNAMLLNEFLKEHRKVEDQQASIAELKSTVAQQQKGMEALTAQLKEQAAQIQKVSAQVEMAKPATKVAVGNQ